MTLSRLHSENDHGLVSKSRVGAITWNGDDGDDEMYDDDGGANDDDDDGPDGRFVFVLLTSEHSSSCRILNL